MEFPEFPAIPSNSVSTQLRNSGNWFEFHPIPEFCLD
jgi:hypothetical protein